MADLIETYGSLSFQEVFSKWFSCETNLTASKSDYYNYIDVEMKGENNNYVKLTLNEDLTFSLPSDVKLNLYYSYTSAATTVQGSQKGYHTLSLAANRSFFKEKLYASMSVNNPFINAKTRVIYQTSFMKSDQTIYNENNIFRLNLKYKFGKPQKNSITAPDRIENPRL